MSKQIARGNGGS